MPTPTSLPSSFTSGDVLTAANMNLLRGAFRILRVEQAVKTDTFSTNSSSFVDITGLSVTITPQSNTSKFLLFALVNGGSGGSIGALRFAGGNSGNFVGAAAGSRTRGAAEINEINASLIASVPMLYLDSPATASAITYKVQVRSSSGDLYVNRSHTDTDSANLTRAASCLIVCEVSA